jgi:hypothetical protein
MTISRPFFFAIAGIVACALALPSDDHHLPAKSKKYIPTFAHDVAPILYAKCADCHHAGEVAPFSLTSYEDAARKAKTIAASVARKQMPPWQAVTHGEFVGERTLTAEQIKTISDWAAAGAPAGNLKAAPPAPSFTPGWQMGKPDFVGAPSQPYQIAAEGADDYRCFVIPTHFSGDRYVTGVELRPGNRKVVHHVLVYLDSSGYARKLEGKDGKPGYQSFGGPGFAPTGSLGGWAPGLQPLKLENDEGFLLPKGVDIVLQCHYHKDGKPETDLTSVGLKFSDRPVDKKVRWEAIGEELIDIAPGDRSYAVKTTLKVPRDLTILDVIPHMHFLGHDMLVTATLPNGTTKTLVDVDRYDYNWQTRYTYKQPVDLPAGTTLNLTAHYDNSEDNPRNPNSPPKRVTFGEQTTNEMCYAFFSYTLDKEHLTKGIHASDDDDFAMSDEKIHRFFDRFDANHDGYLDVPELANLIQYFSAGNGGEAKSKASAGMAIAFYGQTAKGKVTLAEFTKMLRDRPKK